MTAFLQTKLLIRQRTAFTDKINTEDVDSFETEKVNNESVDSFHAEKGSSSSSVHALNNGTNDGV